MKLCNDSTTCLSECRNTDCDEESRLCFFQNTDSLCVHTAAVRSGSWTRLLVRRGLHRIQVRNAQLRLSTSLKYCISTQNLYFLCDIKRQLAQPCVVKWWINEPWIDLFSIGMFKTGTALVQTNYGKLFNPSLLNLSSWKSCWDMKIRHASQCDMFFFNMPVLSRLKSWHLQLKIFICWVWLSCLLLQVHCVALHSAHWASDPLVSGQMFASDAAVRKTGTNSLRDCPACL